MRIFIQVFLACFLWAIQNAILEIKLSKTDAISVMLITYLTALPLGRVTLLAFKLTNSLPTMPSGNLVLWATGSAVLFFIADYLFIGAYTLGGNSTTITLCTLSIPIFVIIIKYTWSKEPPSVHHLLALACLGLAFYFMYLAETKKVKKEDAGPIASEHPTSK